MSAIVKLAESFLGFKVKKSPILEQRNSILKLLILINTPNLLILWLLNTHVPQPYMDEQFHYDQFLAYSRNDFAYWNHKLTTPPGLYYLQRLFSILLGDQLCTLRCLNSLVFGNLFLIFAMKIYEFLDHNRNNLSRSINLALTPTIYFFTFLDYTDAASLAFVTMAFYYNIVRSTNRLFVLSLLAVATRQNNIVWVGYMFFYRIATDYAASIGSIRGNIFRATLCFFKIVFLNKFDILRKNILQLSIVPLLAFYLYRYNDGQLVFGDRQNHQPVFHPTQLLYLSLFIIVNLPISLADYFANIIQAFNRIYYSRHALATYLFLLSLCLLVVDKFSYVHAFTLADNRHYIFYIYRYFKWAKFLMCLVYPLCFILLTRVIVKSKDKLVKFIMWWVFTSLYLMSSGLVEFRYFAIPFAVLTFEIINDPLTIDVEQMHRRNLSLKQQHRMIWTTLGKVLVNGLVLYMFMMRPFGDGSRFMW